MQASTAAIQSHLGFLEPSTEHFRPMLLCTRPNENHGNASIERGKREFS